MILPIRTTMKVEKADQAPARKAAGEEPKAFGAPSWILGNKGLTLLIISDLHGNLAALEAVLAAEPQRDAVAFCGDVVDYGPQTGKP